MVYGVGMDDGALLEVLALGDDEQPRMVPAVSESPILRMRARHHQLARLLAEGKTPRDAAYIMGFAPSSVSALCHDPAFRELVSYHRQQVATEYLDMHGKLANLAGTAAEILQERLEEKPSAFSNGELLKIVGDACDRSVAPPKATGTGPVQINVSFHKAEPTGPAPLTIEGKAE